VSGAGEPTTKATPLVRAFLVVLVLASAGAFVLTQSLKRSQPVVERVFFPRYISPDGDGRKDRVSVRFDLPKSDQVTVSIVDEHGKEIRRLADDERLGKGTHSFDWNGRTDSGERAPDGDYRLRILLREEGRGLTASRSLVLDTTPPRPRILAVTPGEIAPGSGGRRGRVRIRFEGPSDPAPEFRVYRTDGPRVREVHRFKGTRFRRIAIWDGTIAGRPAPDGNYAFAVVVRDRALVPGSAPAKLPPTRAEARPETGVTVANVTVGAPLEPVRAGKVASFEVGPAPREVVWELGPLGGGTVLRRGTADARRDRYRDTERNRTGTRVSLRVPADARSGLYLLRVRAGGHQGIAPLVVRGATNGTRRGPGRVLVVLPTISWQGATPVDDDQDGFADTLDNSDSVLLDRPLAFGRLPAGFAQNVGPLLRFLGRERFGYDLTTDVALARSGGKGLRDHAGTIFAGSERWVPPKLNDRFKEYVEAGGRVASFGTEAFLRSVELRGDELSDPLGPRRENTFGEETSPLVTPPAPLVVTRDEIDMFDAADRFVGEFTRFEQSEARTRRAKLQAAAGRERRTPAFVSYGLGFGNVTRVGAPGWSTLLAEERQAVEVIRVTRRILRLLSRVPFRER